MYTGSKYRNQAKNTYAKSSSFVISMLVYKRNKSLAIVHIEPTLKAHKAFSVFKAHDTWFINSVVTDFYLTFSFFVFKVTIQ